MALWIGSDYGYLITQYQRPRKELKRTRGSTQTLIILHVPFNSAYYFCLHFFFHRVVFFFLRFRTFLLWSFFVVIMMMCCSPAELPETFGRIHTHLTHEKREQPKNERHGQSAKMYNIFALGIVSLAQLTIIRGKTFCNLIFLFPLTQTQYKIYSLF